MMENFQATTMSEEADEEFQATTIDEEFQMTTKKNDEILHVPASTRRRRNCCRRQPNLPLPILNVVLPSLPLRHQPKAVRDRDIDSN